MPDPQEQLLMRKLSIKYVEARKVFSGSRKNPDMGIVEPSTPNLEAELSRLVNEDCTPVKEKVDPLWTPISPSISENMRRVEASTELMEHITESDTESEDCESHVWGHDSCLLVTIPSSTTPVHVVKRNRSNPQDSQVRSTAIHSFLVKLLGQHGLKDCNLSVDNAKMAPDRAIDFDALVKRRVQQEGQRKGRSHHRGHRGSRTNPKEPPRSHKPNTKGLGMRTRALPDQKKRS
jgi:hypothetical protein